MRSAIILLTIFVASVAAGQTADVTTVVVPVVGSVLGANEVYWRTDIELRNDTSSEVTVFLQLAANPDEFFLGVPSLAPGESALYPDVVGMMGAEGRLSPLLVKTSGRQSVTVRASAYGARGNEVFPRHSIAVGYGSEWFPTRVLHGLSFSDHYRTNIGLANLGENDAEIVLAVQRIPGRYIAVRRVTLGPNIFWHEAIQLLFPLITEGDHFSVVVETPSRDVYMYASVIENATNIARFIRPSIGGSIAAR